MFALAAELEDFFADGSREDGAGETGGIDFEFGTDVAIEFEDGATGGGVIQRGRNSEG